MRTSIKLFFHLFAAITVFTSISRVAAADLPALKEVGGLEFGITPETAIRYLAERNIKVVNEQLATKGYVRLSGGILGGFEINLWDIYFANNKLYKIDLWFKSTNPYGELENVTNLLSKKYGAPYSLREFNFPYNVPLKKPDITNPQTTISALKENKAQFSSSWTVSNGTIWGRIIYDNFNQVILMVTYSHSGYEKELSSDEKKRLNEL
jgi:hypothetical protein